MIFRRVPARARLAAASLMLLGACVGAARQQVGSLSELGGDETLVVGRIELVPPLQAGEQKIKASNSSQFENKMFVLTDERYRVLSKEPVMADYAGRIEATLGKTFFVRSSSKPFFIVGGVVYLDIGGRDLSRAYFPGGLKVSIKPGDRAVYIGTVQYHRNEFFEVTKNLIVDDYERANAEFKKKFGTRDSLRKVLLTPAK